MDSPQSVVSPFKSSSVCPEPAKRNADICALLKEFGVQTKEIPVSNSVDSIGILDVFIHQARDIHNICIYHKQDVYAKLSLTSDPENTVSTQIINGGGKNPVFNENLKLNVRNIDSDSSLKCEVWMMSRVKNYLEDQLLGFALVPVSEVLIKNGKLEKEFSMSSTDMFHSRAGFVQLSLSYTGASPEVIAIPSPVASMELNTIAQDQEIPESLPSELDKIEFPDLKIANENHMMVSEYFGIPCANLESNSSENQENGIPNHESPTSSVSTNGCASKSPIQEFVSTNEKKDVGDAESDVSSVFRDNNNNNTIAKPMVSVNIEPEQKVVQQEIVDMYMKSMQQFTESLAKMKLPMDLQSGPTDSGNSSSDQNSQASSGSRVFYGSSAFF